jgi:serine/threonine protein kinase
MAPEILKGEAYTDKVDVYSAGTILYEMLYGVCPHEANCKEDLIQQIEKGLNHEDSV